MKIIYKSGKVLLFALIDWLAGSRIGNHILSVVVDRVVTATVNVKHQDTILLFSTPNWLAHYRAQTFSTKEPDTLTWLEVIPEGAVFWDVGANVGLYSIYAAKKRGAHVFAFEPSVFNLELLARNIYINELQDKIIIIPVALSDALGPSKFKMSSTAWGGALSTFGQDFDQYGNKLKSIFEYQTIGVSMNDAVSLLGIPAPDFIKIDVDGIEHLILRGGANILNHVQSVLVEISDDFAQQAEESTRHLIAAGLELKQKCSMLDTTNQYNQWWVRRPN